VKTRNYAISLILIASLLGIFPATGATRNTQRKNPLANIKAKAEHGAKVAKRIKQLKETNKSVRGALQAFEKNGHKPKVDEAVSIPGRIETPVVQTAYRKANYAPQQETIAGDGVEMIFITVLDLPNEWQGTTIANFYDPYGALEEQYVSDVVITNSEYSPSEWTARYDLKFEPDGIGYINHQPGMFTSFNLGIPIQQQAPPPLSLDPSQFDSGEQMNEYYNLYSEQTLYDIQPEPQPESQPAAEQIQPFQSISFIRPQPRVGPRISPWAFRTITGWRGFAREAGIGCGPVSGGACGIAAAVFRAGAAFGPCFLTGCSGAVIYDAINNLRVVQRR